MQEMERQRLRRIMEEGKAYGYGAEMGRRRATSDYYAKKRAEAEWRRDPTGMKRMQEFLWGRPQRKRKKRK